MNNYKTVRWRKLRERRLKLDGYMCKECRRYGKTKPADTVHHIYQAKDYPELFWNIKNLISLCSNCHNEMHDRTTRELTKLGIELIERNKFKISPHPVGTKLSH